MATKLYQWLPPEGVNLLLVLFLSFLIGLEREERKSGVGQYVFGGVRTFPLIGLIGYSMALLAGDNLLPIALGFIVVGVFLALSYWHKLVGTEFAGVTSEMSGLTTYLMGALVYHQHFWIATTICVASVLLLELKAGLEKLTSHIAPSDILTFGQFLFLSAVILPIVPNEEFTEFQVNPFKTWLVVVAVSAISYGSYVLQRLTRSKGSLIVTAILGGAYSSTLTTIAIAKRSSSDENPRMASGAILVASGMMYLRIAILLALFNQGLVLRLGLPFVVLAAVACLAGWLWSRTAPGQAPVVPEDEAPGNPLELRAAFLFALLFLAMVVATRFSLLYLGQAGLYVLSAIMGMADVDPFIMGMTQAAGTMTTVNSAAIAILIATASNNVIKGIYAFAMSSGRSSRQSLAWLLALAALGLVPILFN